MIRKIIDIILARRHFWRVASFDELSEIYIAMHFRSLALAIIGIFIPIYLYDIGYNISQICLFFVLFFVCRVFMDVIGGYSVARIGPKHTMLASYVTQILAILATITLSEYRWPLLLPAFLWGAGNSLFYIAFHVDFSKVKHSIKSGSELAIVNIAENGGKAAGPVIGGLIAAIFGAEYMFIVAIFVLLGGLIPLFTSPEPVRTRQKLHFRKLKIKSVKRDLVSYSFFAVDNNLQTVIWPLFLAVFLFADSMYLKVGGLVSVGILASVLASYAIGKIIDKKQGKNLLNINAILGAVNHLFRIFVQSTPFALAVSLVGDVTSVGRRMAYHKGEYDAADSHPGLRIVYLVTMEMTGSYAKLIVWTELLLLSYFVTTKQLFIIGFMIAAACSLLVMTQKFKALESK